MPHLYDLNPNLKPGGKTVAEKPKPSTKKATAKKAKPKAK